MILAVILMITFNYTTRLDASFKNEAEVYLSEISYQNTLLLEKQITGDLNALKYLADYLHTTNSDDNTILKGLIEIAKQNNFKRMGIINLDGYAVTTDNHALFLGDREYFINALNGIPSVSDAIIDKTDNEKINVFAVPVYHNDKIRCVLFATQNINSYEEIVSILPFSGLGYSYVIKANGDIVLASSHLNSLGKIDNIFDSIKASKDLDLSLFASMQNNIADRKSGFIDYTLNNIPKFMNYSPTTINDWYVLSIVPASIVLSKTTGIMIYTICMFAIIAAAFLCLLLYNIIIQNKNKTTLIELAYYDSLTKINNITKFSIDTKELLVKYPSTKYAIVQFDIDKFKFINDVYGFLEGNAILTYVAKIISLSIKENECCARISNDVFVLLLQFESKKKIIERLEAVQNSIHHYKSSQSQTFDIILSFGIFLIKEPQMAISTMIDRASIAKKTIKGCRHQTIAFYTEDIRNTMLKEKAIESQMNEALTANQFVVYYQPKYKISNLQLDSAEALVRWQHKDGKMIPPDEFIPLFEKNGFIIQVDIYVFEQVCVDLRHWIDEGKNVVPISVNLSRLHLYNPNFIVEYQAILNKYQIPANLIELELTESAVLDNVSILQNLMEQIHRAGFLLSMDDFGSGYSSLNLLNDLTVDSVKLDREFFNKTADNDRGRSIVSTIIALTKKLGIQTVAEGVETKQQLDFLQHENCDIAQGYYFSKPIPVENFQILLKNKFEGL